MKYLWLVFSFGLAGCGTIQEATRAVSDAVIGMPPPDPSVLTAPAAAVPEPWNIVLTGVGGAVLGVWGWLYRRRLLKTDPNKVE